MADYPRIWDRDKERKIVGETRASWLVLEWEVDDLDRRMADPWFQKHGLVKVNEKNPNSGCHSKWPRWFFNEKDQMAWKFVCDNQRRIGELVTNTNLSAEVLRQIEELVDPEKA